MYGIRDERCSQTSPRLSGNNHRRSECNYCVFYLLIGGRLEIRLGSKYNLLCGNSWTHSVRPDRVRNHPVANVEDFFTVNPVVEKWRSLM